VHPRRMQMPITEPIELFQIDDPPKLALPSRPMCKKLQSAPMSSQSELNRLFPYYLFIYNK
jgi:hypothetical protein